MGNITVSFIIQDCDLNTKEYMDITSKRKMIARLKQLIFILNVISWLNDAIIGKCFKSFALDRFRLTLLYWWYMRVWVQTVHGTHTQYTYSEHEFQMTIPVYFILK